MHLGRLLLRLAIGGTFFVHGTQKLFGWFGGYGPDGTGQFFESLGLRPGRRNAMAAGSTEAAGGLMIATGIGTPIAAAGLAGVMITALRTAGAVKRAVILPNSFRAAMVAFAAGIDERWGYPTDLRRILLEDGWEGHPLLKSYAVDTPHPPYR